MRHFTTGPTAAGPSAIAAGLALAALTGCAGNDVVPTPQFTEAEQKIDEADQAEAQRYANEELNTARENLDQARAAQERGDEELAERLAQRAAVDADYAAAVAENQELQTAVQELRETLETLRQELARGQRQQSQSAERVRQDEAAN